MKNMNTPIPTLPIDNLYIRHKRIAMVMTNKTNYVVTILLIHIMRNRILYGIKHIIKRITMLTS